MSVPRPTQAVILAGGLGTRLRPLTDTRPKPMIEFHGRPFLDYLLELLQCQGIRRVLLLLGYLPEAITEYCGDGSRWNLEIDYSISAVEDDTGRRLWRAKERIDDSFLLMYCDNYWPLRLDRMWRALTESQAQALLTVYDNADDYTRNNVRVDPSGAIAAYDKDRREPNLQGVDIGFGIFPRQVLDLLPDENVSFERVVYPELVRRRALQAYVTGHRYYSVSSLERLSTTEQFLAREPAVIVDRDGVLNRRPPKAEYVRSWHDWHWLPGAQEALRVLAEAGYRVMLVSNQAGVARGVMTEDDVARIHERMTEEIVAAGGRLDGIYYCPHGWDSLCACRKPRPGMLHQAQHEFHLDLSRTVFFGDDERDGQAADAAGCPWVHVSEWHTLLDGVKRLLANHSPIELSVP